MVIKENKFEFAALHAPLNVKDAIILRYECNDEQLDYILNNNMQKVFLWRVVDTRFMMKCSEIKHVHYDVPFLFSDLESDFSENDFEECSYGIRTATQLKGLAIYDDEDRINTKYKIDLSNLINLEQFSGSYLLVNNLERLVSLKTIALRKFNKENLESLYKLNNIDTLDLTLSKIKSLSGIENLNNMQCLYLYYNRNLCDISALSLVKNTLKTLVIENCPKIMDFSVLNELEELEHLRLLGKNDIPDLSFLRNMKKLKTLIISMNVVDGDLSLCLDIPYVFIQKGRKHYNYSDKHMRKEKEEYRRGNENLPEWRRLY